MRAVQTGLRDEVNTLTVFALDASTDLQLNEEQKAMVADLSTNGRPFGETVIIYPNTEPPINTADLGVPPLVK